ncbi:MAG: PEP-CTERM sorting domain-containing protein, partial [Cytophagales bacterium]|nr:PEP-CTERM sorting domain-containing protein [Armatimonadota bacterium]
LMMKKIKFALPVSAFDSRSISFAAAAAVLTTSTLALFPGTVQAQTYVGNAYTLNASLGVGVTTTTTTFGIPVSVTANSNIATSSPIAFTGLLPTPGPTTTLTGTQASASLSSGLTGLVGLQSLGATISDVLRAGIQTTSTTSLTPDAGFGVTSTASVASLGLFNSLTTSLPINARSLVSAAAVQSVTSARLDGSGAIGKTKITDLFVNGALQNLALVDGLTVDADGFVTGSGQIFVNGFGGSRIGTLLINEQITNGDGSLTTNALRLVLTPNASIFSGAELTAGGLTTIAVASNTGATSSTGIIVSSSTAGFAPANVAAPEPGTLALLAASLLPGMGFLRLRRRYRAA